MEKVTLRYLLIEKSGWSEEGTQLPRRHKKNKRLYKKHSSIVRQGPPKNTFEQAVKPGIRM